MSTTDNLAKTACYRCQTALNIDGKVHRRDTCPKCGTSLHSCKFCVFYDPKAYNECRETSADRVVDKEKENFCDYYQFATNGKNNSKDIKSKTEAARSKLDDLFK
jgi:hypothetical protein